MTRKEKVQTDVRLVCGTCGKPLADKPRSNVTRWLFRESRCTCRTPDFKLVSSEPSASGPDLAKAIAASPSANDELKLSVKSGGDATSGLDEDAASKIEDLLGGRYEVQALLGRGGMGAVYKVWDRQLGKTFAIKLLNLDLAQDKDALARFQFEAEAAQRLTHPNLVSVYASGVAKDGSPYLVMDYCEGGNLADLIGKEGFLDSLRATDIFIQIVDAIAYAHRQGVIHRDLKPENIIVIPQENGIDYIKVIDFGIAKVLAAPGQATQNLTQTGEILGSPLYMSPEQCQGQKLDARTDIYALGCLMYQTLAGKPPFEGSNPIQTILKHINEDPPKILGVNPKCVLPVDLERIIKHCLQKEPAARCQNADELLQQLESVRDGKPIKLKERLDSKGRSRRRRLLVFTALATALAAGAAMYSINPVPFVSPPREPYGDAERLDNLSYQYFTAGDYERAIPLLEFGTKTYMENGKHGAYGYEDTYLADNNQHIGKCYLMLKQYSKAAPYYQKALSLYSKFGNRVGMMPEAIKDYSRVLEKLGRSADALSMQTEFKTTGNLARIP